MTALRTSAKRKAPRTVLNIYSVIKAMFRDAEIDGLIDRSPCILTKYQIGEAIDADPEWRDRANYTRAELEQLVTEPRVPRDRRVFYALEGIGALRLGEAAGLCVRHIDRSREPLGALLVRRSYRKDYTKSKRRRDMPIHPVLAAILAEWLLEGWPKMMGRMPTADDLVVPLPPEEWEPKGRGKTNPRAGEMRNKNDSFKRLRKDLLALGMRHRRGHDLRRTMITLARNDGAQRDILTWATHGRSRQATIDEYTTMEWRTLCHEVAKLKLTRRSHDRELVRVI